jgi:hypothetical protein
MVRIASWVVVVGVVSIAPLGARAQPKSTAAALVGASELVKLTTPAGFIDDVVASDDQRIAYVVSDAATKSELHVVTVATKQELVADVSAVTTHPIGLRLLGQRAFVIGVTEDGSQLAALVEIAAIGKKPAGTVVYKLGPATQITVVTRDGKPRVAIHRATSSKAGVRHDIELVAIETGKRVAAGRPFELDTADKNAKLDFKVNHWADGMTRAFGLKGGEWDKKENQRSPDTEATYDLVTGKLVDQHAIADLFEQRRRFQTLADAGGTLDFVRMAWDNAGIQVWHTGKLQAVALDQPITNYDAKSLQGVVNADGSAWIVLKVDPVNPDAVARQKADPEYLDIFRSGSDGKAVRKARILATGVRHRFGVAGDKFWLLERSSGSDRGGRSLALYQLP